MTPPDFPPGRGEGEALRVQVPIATSTQDLLVVLSGSVQGKRDGARPPPPLLDTVSPMAQG